VIRVNVATLTWYIDSDTSSCRVWIRKILAFLLYNAWQKACAKLENLAQGEEVWRGWIG